MTGKFDGKNGPGRPRTSNLTSLKKWLDTTQPARTPSSNSLPDSVDFASLNKFKQNILHIDFNIDFNDLL